MTPKLHHAAFRITPGSLPFVIAFFEELGMENTVLENRWAMMSQGFDIQLSEVTNTERSDNRIKSHVAFLSNDPQGWIEKLERWATENHLPFLSGAWNEKERWFDLPTIFIDWVVEVMHTSVVEEGI